MISQKAGDAQAVRVLNQLIPLKWSKSTQVVMTVMPSLETYSE